MQLDLELIRAKSQRSPAQYRFRWRLKSTEWAELLKNLPSTSREAVQALGKIMYHKLLHLVPWYVTSLKALPIIELVRRYCQIGHQGWDRPLEEEHLMSDSEWLLVKEQLQLAIDVIASDASPKGFGHVRVILDSKLNVISSNSSGHLEYTEEQFKERVEPIDPRVKVNTHTSIREPYDHRFKVKIFLMELHGAIVALQHAESQAPGTPIILCVDNTAVFWCLRRGYSTSSRATEMMKAVHHILPRVHLVHLVSADNVADCPSRNNNLDYEDRLKRTARAVLADLDGRRRARCRDSMSFAPDADSCGAGCACLQPQLARGVWQTAASLSGHRFCLTPEQSRGTGSITRGCG